MCYNENTETKSKGEMKLKKKILSIILAIFLFVPCMFLLTACGGGNGNGNGGGSGDGGKQPSNPSSLTEDEIKSYIPNEFSLNSGVKMTISTNSTFNGQTAETVLTYYKTGNNEIVSTQNQFDSISDGEVIKNDNDRIFIKIGDKYYEKTRDNLRDEQYATEETSKGGYQRFVTQEMKYLSDLTKYIDYAENLNVEMSKDILGSDYKTTYSGKQVKEYDDELRKNVITYDIKMSTIFVLSFPDDNWYPTKIEDVFYAPTELKAYSVDVKVILNEDKTYNHVELLVQRHKDYTPSSLENEKYEKTVIDFEYGKKVNFNDSDLLEGLKSTPSFGDVTFDGAEINDSRYENGKKVTLPTPTKEDATFLGWYYDASYTMPVENNVITVVGSNSNYTNRVFAKWSNGGRPTLVMNGGKFSANAEENFNEADSVGSMRSVVLEQYGKAFVGFYKDAEFSEMIDYFSEEPLTSDMTFYAKWVDLERVTINTSHFTYKTIDQMGKPGYKFYAPVVETEAGWIFKNWIDNNGVTYTKSTVNDIKFGEIKSLTAVFEQGTIVRIHDIETVLGWVETEGDDKDGKELDTYFIYGEDTEKSIKYHTTRYNDWLNDNWDKSGNWEDKEDELAKQFPVNNDLIYTVTVPTGKYITDEWGSSWGVWQQLPKSVRNKYPSTDPIPGWTMPYMGFTVPLYFYDLSTIKPTVDNPWQRVKNVMAEGEPIDMWVVVKPHEIVNFQIKVQGFDEPIKCRDYFDTQAEPVGGEYGRDDEVFFPSGWEETYNFPAGTTYRDYVLEHDHIKYYDHNWWKDRVIGTAANFQALKEAIIREKSWYDLEDGIPTLYVKLERYTTVNVHVGDTTTKLYPIFKDFMEENGGCSELYERYISGYNRTRVNVSYDDCNPFGMIAGDFGEITSLSKHTSQSASESTIVAFNSLSELFATFMGNFEIPTNDTEYIPTVSGNALNSYTQFYNKAIELYNSSLVSFTKNVSNDLTRSAVIGVNHPYTMAFGGDISPKLINFQTVIANLFGFSSKTEFMDYAQDLANTYAQHRTNITNSLTTNEALENGCFYTSNGSFVFPIAVKNELASTVLAYVILDTSGLVSVWVNDITAALWATNFNSSYHTYSIINNELYCKNILFVTRPENDSALIRYLSYGYSEDEGETQYVPLPAKYYFDMPFNGIYYAPVSTLGVPAGKIIEGYYYDAQFTNPCDLFGTMMADRLYAGENIDIYAKFVDADSIQVRVENKSYFYDKSYSFTNKYETTENGTIKKYGTVTQNDNSEYFFTFTSPVGLYDGWRENLTEMDNADYKYLDVLLELGYLRKVDLLQKTAKYDFVTNGQGAMKNYTVENTSGTKIGDLYNGYNNPDKDESEGGETTTTTGRYYYVYEFTNIDSNGTLVFDYNDLIAIWQRFMEKYDGTLMFEITLNEVFNYVNVTQVRYYTQNTWGLDSDGNIDLNGFSGGECNVVIGNNCYLHYNDKDGNGNLDYIRVILGAYDNKDMRREEQNVFYLDKTFTMCTELDHRNNSDS